tara:strand:- start:1387 stop:1542 length:156 start_codon:yes stop_codon:yes gene_type:complete
MDVDPQAVINALSGQIGALQTENTILKMALNELAKQNSLSEDAAEPEAEGV